MSESDANESSTRLPATGAIMPWVSLRRHWKMGALVATLVLLLGGVLAVKKGKPTYAVTAVVHIAPRFVNVLKEPKDFDVTSYQQFRQFVEHQTKTIARYDIVLDALQSLGDHRFAWQQPGESERHAAERLMAAITVTAVKDTYLITTKLESGNPQYLDEILNAVVNTYVRKVHQETLFYERDARSQSLRDRRRELQHTLEARSKRRTQIAQELGVTNFSENGINPFDNILMDSRTALAQAHRQTIEAEAQLAILTDNSRGGTGGALNALAADLVSKDAGLSSLKAGLNARRAKLLEQLSGLEAVHPLRRQIERELGEIKEESDRATALLMKELAEALLTQRRAEVNRAGQIEAQLEKQVAAQQERGATYAGMYHEALSLNAEIDRLRKQMEEIDNRLDFFQTESNAPGYARMESAARPPENPVSGGRKKLLIMSGVASLLAFLLVPMLIDLLDRRIRTVGQAAKVLGYPPMASFFEQSTDVEARRIDADRKRRLAITLDRERRSHGAHVILLTGVNPGAGVTGLAFELARELGELGCRALVIEANALKPDPRYEEPLLPGLVELLSGEGDVEACIQPAQGLLPDRIGVGFSGLMHLHNYGVLPEILEHLQPRYPVIFIDAPPVLLSADTEYLASIADITLLLVAALRTLPGDIRRTVDVLRKIDPRTIGFIVTRLERFRGGGYYDKMIREHMDAEQAARDVLKSHPLRQSPEST